MFVRFNSSALQKSFESFKGCQESFFENLRKFTEDLESLEKIFKSVGVSYLSAGINDKEFIVWDLKYKRIMYCELVHEGAKELIRPLAEMPVHVRIKAQKHNWLVSLLLELTDYIYNELSDVQKLDA